jgi:hypothetical protein
MKWVYFLASLPVAAGGIFISACVSDVPVTPDGGGVDSGQQGSDSGVGGDSGNTGDSSSDAPSVTYHAFGDNGVWSTVDIKPLVGTTTYFGAAFDDKYMYFAPVFGSAKVARLDTTSPSYTTPSSPQWQEYDLASSTPAGTSYVGAVRAGKYIYFVPEYIATNKAILARYDSTSGSFSTGWTTMDLATVGADAIYLGGTYDGRYVYLAGNSNYGAPKVRFARYDTQGVMTSAASWQVIDPSVLIDANAYGYKGAAYDGRYVYYVPRNTGGQPGGLVVRYDTQATFTQAGAWSKYDLVPNVNINAKGFTGAVFDGRYLYFIPSINTTFVARYDTQQPFTTQGSWSTFDVTTANPNAKGFFGGAFDGRYVYLVPGNNGTSNGLTVRYDTTVSFGSTSSWTSFDIASVNAGAVGFAGAGFDGRYIYYVPAITTVVARFDAKNPPSLPPMLGSFL